MERAVAALGGGQITLLDHIGVIAEAMQVPLFLTSAPLFEAASRYYPNVEAILLTENEYLACLKEQEWIFQCTAAEFQKLKREENKLIYCPHGNSDKGHIFPLSNPICRGDMALVYGEHMLQRISDQGHTLGKHLRTGNYRRRFYSENKSFYDDLIEKELFCHLPKQRTYLYAPTWSDIEESSSFFTLIEPLLSQLPSNSNLIVKLHPLLLWREKARVEALLSKAQGKSNVLILGDYPLVYPLFARVDALITDVSSIGYDFLAEEKPLFFFDPFQREKGHPSLFLHQTGVSIGEENLPSLYSFLEKNFLQEIPQRSKVYTYAFGEELPLSEIRSRFLELIRGK